LALKGSKAFVKGGEKQLFAVFTLPGACPATHEDTMCTTANICREAIATIKTAITASKSELQALDDAVKAAAAKEPEHSQAQLAEFIAPFVKAMYEARHEANLC
jgi:hypothetical protein